MDRLDWATNFNLKSQQWVSTTVHVLLSLCQSLEHGSKKRNKISDKDKLEPFQSEFST